MQAITVIKGADTPLSFQILEEDSAGIRRPKDLSSAVVTVCFPQSAGGYLELASSGAKVNIEAGAGGVFSVDWEETDTSLLKKGQSQSIQAKIEIGGKTSIVIFENVLTVKEALC